MTEARRTNDEKTIQGFVRDSWSNPAFSIPQDIINLVLLFYHIAFMETFKHYNSDKYEVSNDGFTVTKIGYSMSVCYGSEVIPSSNGGIYHWKFKIKREAFMAIGIDEAKHIREDFGNFVTYGSESKMYSLYSDGDGRQWDRDEYIDKGSSFRFNDNDIVMMTLNLSDKSLSYKINDGIEKALFTDIAIGPGIDYCMAVYIAVESDSIQLENVL